ncbi:hypothetical protein PVAP13_5NG243167 [Panicum virgatum]|uniref:Uncharacterized protein n=1 Tax=Panicum virgatum TaxID=38727 RepID=A0A8T0RTX8_PANVG|nr:hypothetical protein PVAP13_5NG243167 [Panicum virgatum]
MRSYAAHLRCAPLCPSAAPPLGRSAATAPPPARPRFRRRYSAPHTAALLSHTARQATAAPNPRSPPRPCAAAAATQRRHKSCRCAPHLPLSTPARPGHVQPALHLPVQGASNVLVDLPLRNLLFVFLLKFKGMTPYCFSILFLSHL